MRLKAHIWVKSYLRRCQVQGCFAAVVRHGHDDAGAIYIRINLLNGMSKLFAPAPMGFDDDSTSLLSTGRQWMAAIDDMPADDARIEMLIQQQMQLDPDFWVVEVEDRDGRDFLDEELLHPDVR